ncbi:TPA: hypothetical protein ACH3X1_000225 [Trebouxia sp. C0004]
MLTKTQSPALLADSSAGTQSSSSPPLRLAELNSDITVNGHGGRLLRLCEETAMVLCTGRTAGDTPAQPSFRARSNTEPSRLDHALVDCGLFSAIQSCRVGYHQHESDHFPLELQLLLTAPTLPAAQSPPRTPTPKQLHDPAAWDSFLSCQHLPTQHATQLPAPHTPPPPAPAHGLNQPLTLAEVEVGLQRLHNGRSGALYGYTSELLRYAQLVAIPNDPAPAQLLAPCLVVLFNAAFSTGQVSQF